MTDHLPWLQAARETTVSYRRMIDGIVSQLTPDEVFRRPTADTNSVATLLRHLAGNLESRWTDFLTTDGEKPSRNRDAEFSDWEGDLDSLMQHFDAGWAALTHTLESLDSDAVRQTVLIRGESHSVPFAISRSLTHISYHVGQMAIIARLVHDGSWKWLTIAPGDSQTFNDRTWGTAASRAVFSNPQDQNPTSQSSSNAEDADEP